MLEMSEQSKRERLKEITESNNKKIVEPELGFWAQTGTAFDAAIATAPGGEKQELSLQLWQQMERFRELTGEKHLHFGFEANQFPTVDQQVKDYSALSERIKSLKEQGHDIKDIEEVRESVNAIRRQAVEKSEIIEQIAERDNKYKAMLANVLGSAAGYVSTPEGLLSTVGAVIGGEGIIAAGQTAIRAIGSLAVMEGTVGAWMAGEEVKVRADIKGEEVNDVEVEAAQKTGFLVTAGLGVAIGAAPHVGKAAVSGFTKLNGLRTDKEARDALIKIIKGVDTTEAQKGAVPPEVKAQRDQAAELHDVYMTKPENITAEEHVTRLDAQVEELKAQELEVPTQNETIDPMYEKDFNTLTPEDIQTISEVDELLKADETIAYKGFDDDLKEEVDLKDVFTSGQEELKQLDDVIACMTRGANT